jgi:hypothetical protein
LYFVPTVLKVVGVFCAFSCAASAMLNGLTLKTTIPKFIRNVIPSLLVGWFIERLVACDAFNPEPISKITIWHFGFTKNNMKCILAINYCIIGCYPTRTSRTQTLRPNYFWIHQLHYFFRVDYDQSRTLTLWGAGFKGKLPNSWKNRNVPFIWICNSEENRQKTHLRYQCKSFTYLNELKKPWSIVTVANERSET